MALPAGLGKLGELISGAGMRRSTSKRKKRSNETKAEYSGQRTRSIFRTHRSSG